MDAAVERLKEMFEADGMGVLQKTSDGTDDIFLDSTRCSRKLRLGVTSSGGLIVETGFGFEDLVRYLSRYEKYDGSKIPSDDDDDNKESNNGDIEEGMILCLMRTAWIRSR